MNTQCFFSFIIPVYKVEKYLPQCLESILCQTYPHYEIILVDDGSPDQCPQLCDSYKKQDSRIRVIHKENGGLSSARNAGMVVAQGDYIIFLDSDDYWQSPESLSLLYRHIEETASDVVVIKHTCFLENTNTFQPQNLSFSQSDFASGEYDQQLHQLVQHQLYDTCAWNKIFKRKLLQTADLSFQEKIISEDLDWAARLCLVAQSVSILSEPVYVYRKGRPGSITSSIKMKNLVDTKGSIIRCLNYPSVKEQSDLFQRAYYSYVAYRYIIWLAESTVVKDPQVKELTNEMKSLRWLLQYDANKKVRMAKLANRILGLNITSKLLGWYLSSKR